MKMRFFVVSSEKQLTKDFIKWERQKQIKNKVSERERGRALRNIMGRISIR